MSSSLVGCKGPVELLRLCISVLQCIEDARKKSLSCNDVSKPVLKVLKILTDVAFPTFSSADSASKALLQTPENVLELENSLVSCMRICQNIINETENHFGVYEESICRVELASVFTYLNLLIESTVVIEPIDPVDKVCTLTKSHISLLIPNIVTKLFWIHHFGDEINVSWEKFRQAFVTKYGEQKEYVMSIMKSSLANSDERVDIYQYVSFTKDAHGPYHAFQRCCDPGTVVYCAGIVEDSSEPSVPQPRVLTSLLGLNIVQVACGGQHAAVLTAEGQVLTWGRGGFGRLGHGNLRPSDTPLVVEALRDMETIQVACGFAYTAVVTRAGALYMWGAGENGRLGLGDVLDRLVPSKVEELRDVRVAGVYAGSVHTCMLSDRGEVYVCGKCEYTGHGRKDDLLVPRVLSAFDGVPVRQVSVGPGGYHTIALTTRGDVYTWGHNRVGQLGYPNSESVPRNLEGAFFLPTPHLVKSIAEALTSPEEFKPVQVVAGWGHTSILLEDGRVLMCGRNYQGQLGLGDPSTFPTNERGHPYQPKFCVVQSLAHKRVIQVACGGEHSVLLCDDNDLYSVGAGGKGQLAQGHLNGCTEPKLAGPLRVQGRKLFQIACGNNCTLILAGKFQTPSLMRLTAEIVKSTPVALERLLACRAMYAEICNFVQNQDVSVPEC